MSDNKLERIILESWATLDYRANEWGPERIAFDAVSNHFPEDSGGTAYYVKLRQDKKLVNLEDYDPNKTVEEIVMADNGTGYPYHYTIIRYSSKQDLTSATGQFGEGLKMISAAAIRHGVDLHLGSRNWRAKPFAKEIIIGDEEDEPHRMEVLCQEVKVGYDKYFGSFTIIRNPSEEIIEQVLTFRDRIIDFKKDIMVPIESHSLHRIFFPNGYLKGELFVKKIKYDVSKPLLLTYQILGNAANNLLSPDRDHVIEPRLDVQLGYVISLFDEIEIIKATLVLAKDCYEGGLTYSSITPAHPEMWVSAFHQLYGEKAVLEEKSRENVNSDAESLGFNVVRSIPNGLQDFLIRAGIPLSSQRVSYNVSWEFVSPDELTPEQFKVYQLYREINEILIPEGRHEPEIYIFSKAMKGSQEATWFRGLASLEKGAEKIYIRLDQLKDRQTFCSTYGHELCHVLGKCADVSKEFEKELTEALGTALELLVTE
ncbi:MAG: hypothetical protein Q8Q01_04095 [archaeon]|nr:hypothetical protein [archaeon]